MVKVLSHIVEFRTLLGICLFLLSGTGFAQRISFNTWTGSDDITILSPQGAMPTLDFNQKMRALVPGTEAVNIGLVDNQAVIYEIEAPEGFDLTTEKGLKAAMEIMEPKHFLMPFVAHAFGTFIGAILTAIIARSHRMLLAMIIGIVFLAGGIFMVAILPSPMWFNVLDLGLAYIPMAYLGARLIKRKK